MSNFSRCMHADLRYTDKNVVRKYYLQMYRYVFSRIDAKFERHIRFPYFSATGPPR